MGFVMGSAYLPVFHNLQLTSTYEVTLAVNYFTTENVRNIPSFRTLQSGLAINIMLMWLPNVCANSKIMYCFYFTEV